MKFFDRKSIIELLQRRVVDFKEGYRQNIALVGPAFIGKTSILQEFLGQLKDEKILPIYLDLADTDFNHFVNTFAGRFLYHFLKNKNISTEGNLNVLLEQASRLIPATVLHIKKILQQVAKDKRVEAYHDLLTLPEILQQESDLFCLIAMDEFQFLEEFGLSSAFMELGKKIMVQKKCIYLVVSSQKAKAQKIISEKLSLLFGNFEVVEVGLFPIKTSLEFIEQALHDHYLEKSYKNFLVDFTAGHPFYLRTICEHLLRNTSKEGPKHIFLNNLIDTLEQALFDKWGVLHQHFSSILTNLASKKVKNLSIQILLAIIRGQNKLPLLIEEVGGNRNVINSRLTQLLEAGAIVKNGNLFYIADKLFAFWLSSVYQRKSFCLTDDPEELRNGFKDDVRLRIDSFIDVSGNDLQDRIFDLLQTFDNELFQLNGRKHRLPSFTNISPLSFNGFAAVNLKGLLAHTEGDVWAVAFKEGLIMDTDVTAFLSATKELKQRVARHIIISLNEIETNARLRALQEKIWVWNAQELNFILNLYGKPYIVK